MFVWRELFSSGFNEDARLSVRSIPTTTAGWNEVKIGCDNQKGRGGGVETTAYWEMRVQVTRDRAQRVYIGS